MKTTLVSSCLLVAMLSGACAPSDESGETELIGAAEQAINLNDPPPDNEVDPPPPPPPLPPMACDLATAAELQSLVNKMATKLKVAPLTGYAVFASRHVEGLAGPCQKSAAGGFAKSAVDSGTGTTLPMSAYTSTPIGSVSKVVTATVIMDMLAKKNVSPYTEIGAYLPPGLVYGPGVTQITFNQLMRHRSGMPLKTDANTESLKSWLATGITDTCSDGGFTCTKTYEYSNMGYVLLQLLAARLIDLTAFNGQSDLSYVAGQVVESYVFNNYFKSMGIEGSFYGPGTPSCTFPNATLAYPPTATVNVFGAAPAIADGHPGCGTGRWNFSARNLGLFIDRLHRGSLVSKDVTDIMEARAYGWDGISTTPNGTSYVVKGGLLPAGNYDFKARATVFPGDTVFVVVENSSVPLGATMDAAWDEH